MTDLTAYKAELRNQILAVFEANGVVKTLVKIGMHRTTYYAIKNDEIKNVETLKKWYEAVSGLTYSRKTRTVT